MKRTLLIIAIMTALMTTTVPQTIVAMPPHPQRLAEMQALKSFGEPTFDYAAFRQECLEKGIDQPSNLKLPSLISAGTVDTFYILAILIQFPNKTAQTSTGFFDTLIYADQTGTVKNYYLENSYGTLSITTVTLPSAIGWLTSANNSTYYTSGGNYGLGTYPNNAQKLVEEAVDLANPYVDYSNFDNDGDGWVDGLIVVHTGRGAEYTMNVNDIWSHKWGISTRIRDGKYISDYSMMPEYWVVPRDMTCGVYVHELGHIFGLPDLYDTDGTSYGVGDWSLMASGSWNGADGDSPSHLDAWSKIQLGFAMAINVTSTTMGASIPAVETTSTIYRLWTSGTIGDEYFLVENRQQTGYDLALPSEGLLIWHIDEMASSNDDEWYPPTHLSSGNYLVALEQADSLWQIEKRQSYGNAGDPYPGSTTNRNFTPLTNPNSNSYSGGSTLVAVTAISDSQDTMTADFTVSFAADVDDDFATLPENFNLTQNSPNPFNNETIISFSLTEKSDVDLEIFNLLGQKAVTLVSDSYEPGTYSIHWDGNDAGGRPLPTGVYFYRLIAGDASASKKMLLLK